MTLLATRLAWSRLAKAERAIDLRVSVLASFTVNPLEPYLGMALADADICASVAIGPYNQMLQELLLPTSETAEAAPDVVVVWPRLEDLWTSQPLPLLDGLDAYCVNLLELVDAALAAASRWSAVLLFVLPELPVPLPLGAGDAGNPLGVAAATAAAREAARSRLCGSAGVLVADAEETVRWLGVRNALDPRRLAGARIPYTEEAFSDMGTRLARLLVLARRGARKVAVVDADNTLWGGVVGEDGAAAIDLLDSGPGAAYRGFQRWLIELRRAGMLVAVASKNNEPELWEAFARDDMVLSRASLAAWRINWKPKSENIDAMAAELNLGTASFVFIDDNDIELAEVTTALPGVRACRMPADPALWWWDVAATGALDRLPPTASDTTRAEGYAQETQRRELRDALDPASFLASLGLRVRVSAPASSDLSRLAQLVAKTNQFTLDGVRHSEAELARIVASPHSAVRLFAVVDRFGDYGTVGAVIVRRGGVLDTFVLSCRAMGRGVEVAMAAVAGELADGFGAVLRVVVREGAKNQPARSFFSELGVDQFGEEAAVQCPGWPAHVEREETT